MLVAVSGGERWGLWRAPLVRGIFKKATGTRRKFGGQGVGSMRMVGMGVRD